MRIDSNQIKSLRRAVIPILSRMLNLSGSITFLLYVSVISSGITSVLKDTSYGSLLAQATPVNDIAPQSPLLIDDFKRRFSPAEQTLPGPIKSLLVAYPESLKTATHSGPYQGELIWRDGEVTLWTSPKRQYSLDEWSRLSPSDRETLWMGRPYRVILDQATLAEQLLQIYPRDRELPRRLPIDFEPGRLRDESFFKRMYGSQRSEITKTLTVISWGEQRLRVSKKHRIDERLRRIYSDLKRLPHRLHTYYEPSAGAYHWRHIKGTKRLSVHSFGAAIDIAVKRSNYWKWTLKVYGEDKEGRIPYKNQFPLEVVKIFERYGYIWGGWWYHHDTMHFEYRPELLVNLESATDDQHIGDEPRSSTPKK